MKPFARNKKLYFPLGEIRAHMLKTGDEFLKRNSKVPFKVVDPCHNMGIMCKHDGRSGHVWFSKNHPVVQLMVIS